MQPDTNRMTLPTAARTGQTASPSLSILLVEDDPAQADLLAAQLREHGHAVDVVMDGRSVAAHVAAHPFDLILLDRMLPQLDGMSVLKWLRAEGVGLPVILLTALGSTAERVEGLEAGADDYIVKPFEIGI